MRVPAALGLGLCFALALGGCRSEAARAPVATAVAIRGMVFDPASLALAPGDRVTWTNEDLVPHTVTDAAGAFDSGTIAPQASWTWVAAKAGRIDYACRFHPTMKGTLVVR